MNLVNATMELEKLFDNLNRVKFESKLPKPMICIQSYGRGRKLYGWCTLQKIWKENEEADGYYEITICAEFLKRPFEDIATTLLHEMVHLYNVENGVKDCSNNNVYHNKKFKNEAEARGLKITKDKTIGWSISELNEDTKLIVHSLGIDESVFGIARVIFMKGTKKAPKKYTYTCPVCKTKVISEDPELKAYCFNDHEDELFVRK